MTKMTENNTETSSDKIKRAQNRSRPEDKREDKTEPESNLKSGQQMSQPKTSNPETSKAEELQATTSEIIADGPISSEALSEINSLSGKPGEEKETQHSLRNKISTLETRLAEIGEDRLRAIADAENVRRRTQREVESSRKYACEPLARGLITVIDNLQRALSAVPEEKIKTDEDFKNLHLGVEITTKELEQAFAKASIERIDPLGEPFDPNLHQAMFEIPDPDGEAGIIKNVIAPGYRLHDRLLRAAMVGVSKKS